MTVVTNYSDLTQAMRSALTDRGVVRRSTANALARRGLAEPITITDEAWRGGYEITLTAAGEAAREAQFPPVSARVRNTRTGRVGTVVAIHRQQSTDSVELSWGDGKENTFGSPAYLEVVVSEQCVHCDGSTLPNLNTCERHTDLVRPWGVPEDEHRAMVAALTRNAEVTDETVTVTVPRHLAEAVTAAWEEAYRVGRDSQAERFRALADAYGELNSAVDTAGAPWLSRTLIDARDEATTRAARESGEIR